MLLQYVDVDQAPPHLTAQGKSDGKGWYYEQKETKQVFRALSHHHLLKQIRSHREGMAHKMTLDLESGWQDRLEDEMCLAGENQRECHERGKPGPWHEKLIREGRDCWKKLHDYALRYPKQPTEAQIKKTKEWLVEWSFTIPSWECNCKRSYDQWSNANQVDLGSRKAFYTWSVNLHNHINEKLKKEIWVAASEILNSLE